MAREKMVTKSGGSKRVDKGASKSAKKVSKKVSKKSKQVEGKDNAN